MSVTRTILWVADWSEVEPLEYLTPFLDVIKSPETSGNVTDVALTAVYKILQGNLLGKRYLHVGGLQFLNAMRALLSFSSQRAAYSENFHAFIQVIHLLESALQFKH